jgi:hypothetical protein
MQARLASDGLSIAPPLFDFSLLETGVLDIDQLA